MGSHTIHGEKSKQKVVEKTPVKKQFKGGKYCLLKFVHYLVGLNTYIMIDLVVVSVTSKKSLNVYKCCPTLISIEKLKIL